MATVATLNSKSCPYAQKTQDTTINENERLVLFTDTLLHSFLLHKATKPATLLHTEPEWSSDSLKIFRAFERFVI